MSTVRLDADKLESENWSFNIKYNEPILAFEEKAIS